MSMRQRTKFPRVLRSGVRELTRIEKTKWLHGGSNYVREVQG